MNDILLNSDLDAVIATGDFAVGESTIQQQELLLVCNKGDFKENPTICVGVAGWLKDDEPASMLAEVKKEFERDGMTIINLSLTNGNLLADAHY
jgi:hypothetical protein